MPFSTQYAAGVNFKTVLDSFAQVSGLPFQDVLTAEHIEDIAAAEEVHFGSAPKNIYTVPVTLWAFLAQVLSKEKACVAAAARILGVEKVSGPFVGTPTKGPDTFSRPFLGPFASSLALISIGIFCTR